jgi:hypothetical protein
VLGKRSEWDDSSLVYEAKGKQFGGKYARYKYGRYKFEKKNSYKFYGKRVPKSFYFIFSDNTECSVDFKNAFFIPKMLQTFLDMKVLQLTRRH